VKAYVPPHLRGKAQPSSVKLKLHEDEEKPDKVLKIKRDEDPAVLLEKKVKAIKKVSSLILYCAEVEPSQKS
jgi:hypothetical protein